MTKKKKPKTKHAAEQYTNHDNIFFLQVHTIQLSIFYMHTYWCMETDLQRYTNYTNSNLLMKHGIGDKGGKEDFHFIWSVWFIFKQGQYINNQ